MTGLTGTPVITKLPIPRFFLLFVSALIALGALTMDMYLPAVPAMREHLGGTVQQMNLTIAIFFVGYGLGQFVGGPLSDRLGRKPVGMAGLVVFVAATAFMLDVETTGQLTALRLIQALGAGFSTIICMGAVRDAYVDEALGQRIALTMIVMLMAPLFAPTIGAGLLLIGLPAIFVALLVYAGVLMLLFQFAIPETRQGEREKISVKAIAAQYWEVLSYRRGGRLLALGYMLTSACSSTVLMIFLTTASFIYQDHFGLSPNQFAIAFACNVVCIIVFQFVSMARMRRGKTRRTIPLGLGIQLIAVSLLLVAAWTGKANLWITGALLAPAVGCMGLVNPNGAAIFMTFFPRLGGSAAAASTTLLFGFGMIGAAVATFFHDGTLVPIAATMWGACVAAIVIFTTMTVDLKTRQDNPVEAVGQNPNSRR